ARILRNDGSHTFTDISGTASLTGVSSGSAAWGDYDNDGKLDLLITGTTGSAASTRLYHNDGGNSFSFVPTSLAASERGAAAWGDVDGDDDLDVVLTGCTDDACSGRLAELYHNDGGGTFVQLTVTPSALRPESDGTAIWGDYDIDGNPD